MLKRPENPSDIIKEGYETEKEYVIKFAKKLITEIKGRKFDVLQLRKLWENNRRLLKNEYPISKVVCKELDEKDSWDFVGTEFCYETGNQFRFDPATDNFNDLGYRQWYMLDYDRIRFYFTFYYLSIVVEAQVGSYSDENDRPRMSMKIYDIPNKVILERIDERDTRIWLDKDVSIYSFTKRMKEAVEKGEDLDPIIAEFKEYFPVDYLDNEYHSIYNKK